MSITTWREDMQRLAEQEQANTSTPAEPSAFPILERGGNGLDIQDPGMTLRDWFAGQALIGFLSNTNNSVTDFDELAAITYKLADFMMVERNK